MANEEEEGERKPNKARLEDEFLKNPYSGAAFRNPFLNKNRTGNRSMPIILQAAEYNFNCLDEAGLGEWKSISITEASLKQMATRNGTNSRSPLQRAALQRLNDLPSGYEFVVNLRKSTYVPPRVRRRVEQKTTSGQMVDKLNIEVTDHGSTLRVEAINEGLVAVWNRTFQGFQMRPGDYILRANQAAHSAAAILEEMSSPNDALKMTVRRPPPSQASRIPTWGAEA